VRERVFHFVHRYVPGRHAIFGMSERPFAPPTAEWRRVSSGVDAPPSGLPVGEKIWPVRVRLGACQIRSGKF
jgi:hypothetical protein